ncbi:chalcone isomerase family protein [Vibrio sp.]|uniref:chalcone isomerase family protein n=1 Tax=Vibrio sp. TaxID=678 RepID=UPI003D1411BD
MKSNQYGLRLLGALVAGLVNAAVASPFSSEASNGAALDWQQWRPVGSAQLSWWFFDIYQSHLLTPSGQYQAQTDISPHPLALSIHYQRDIDRLELLQATADQWQKLGYSKADVDRWLAQLESIFPDVRQGQQLAYVTDGRRGQFYFAEQQKPFQAIGHIGDERLNDAFLAIWLSPKTTYPDLRRQLIGAHHD